MSRATCKGLRVGANAFSSMARQLWRNGQVIENPDEADAALVTAVLSAIDICGRSSDQEYREGFSRALVDLLLTHVAESGAAWLDQWDPVGATGGERRLLTDDGACSSAPAERPGPVTPQAAETVRGIDQVVQGTTERVVTLCRAAKLLLTGGGSDRDTLLDVHELLEAITEAAQEAQNYVNAEAETLGANFVDQKRRRVRSQLKLHLSGGAAA